MKHLVAECNSFLQYRSHSCHVMHIPKAFLWPSYLFFKDILYLTKDHLNIMVLNQFITWENIACYIYLFIQSNLTVLYHGNL